ncbi:hypothetical protein H0H93_016720 [Arthromyces matolae]|nr:hypothetical protein H0H93_016720 [Arthromyces matolae]
MFFDATILIESEVRWRDDYDYLKGRGYTLRTRYHPNWQPSWVNPSKVEEECEDSYHIPTHQVLDATRTDGSIVVLKRVDTTRPQNDLPILQHLSSQEFTSNPRNHCVPIIEVLEPREGSSIAYVVMPLLYDPDHPAFETIGEVLSFWKQMIEGLHYMHEKLITHGDCKFGNFMADTQHLFDSPPHPSRLRMRRDFSGPSKQLASRTLKPVKYYLIDFGLSKVYQPEDAPFLRQAPWGGDKTIPEFRDLAYDDAPLCDPFAVDVYCLGNYLRQTFLDGYDHGQFRTGHPKGFEFLRELITDMVNEIPSKRPQMVEVSCRFDAILAKQGSLKLRSPIVSTDAHYEFSDWVSHWSTQLIRIARRIPAIPRP